MTFSRSDAETVLTGILGQPINKVQHGSQAGTDNDKVMGFKTQTGRVLALNREIKEDVHIWFEPPDVPSLDGVMLRSPTPKNDNLKGALASLGDRQGLQVEISSEESLRRFLDWYDALPMKEDEEAIPDISPKEIGLSVDPDLFLSAFNQFKNVVRKVSGEPFVSFDEGLPAQWEDYKPRLREYALGLLGADAWLPEEIGTGSILERAISAVEIYGTESELVNNLVYWQNRYGHANRAHRSFLDAQTNPDLCAQLEQLLYDFYRDQLEDGDAFEQFSDLAGRKYDLLAYLFFLKDDNRFMPIKVTTFDLAFKELGIDFVTSNQCSWENYVLYNDVLKAIRGSLQSVAGLTSPSLIDAHSFCWMLIRLEKELHGGRTFLSASKPSAKGSVKVFDPREISIVEMVKSTENTAKNSNGQLVERTVKEKKLLMTTAELEKRIKGLLDLQEDRCALTGLPLQYSGEQEDEQLRPSLDRIDSSGHYETGNLQVVCRFVNFWKSDTDNDEFIRLLSLVRSDEE